nr:MAG TPA: hypothetical protein [Caudoviricetes sp.]
MLPRGNKGDLNGFGSFSSKNTSSVAYAWQNDGKTYLGALVTFDPSTVSSLYQSNLNEVRVNGLFGTMLIRAF